MADPTAPWHFSRARDLFDATRDASREADGIARQLRALEERALSMGSPGTDARVRTTPDPQHRNRMADAYMDRAEGLRRRQDDDYRLIDLACAVLYGEDNEAGLASIAPPWWADALWWHYVNGASWPETAKAVHYSPQRCQQVRSLAFDTIDSWGFAATIAGRQLNDDCAREQEGPRQEG